jgi:hypothetical protein
MSRKLLWTSLTASLTLFALVSFGPGTQTAEATGGCYMTGSYGPMCNVVQICEISYCHYHIYRESAPCRPSGAGPACDEE